MWYTIFFGLAELGTRFLLLFALALSRFRVEALRACGFALFLPLNVTLLPFAVYPSHAPSFLRPYFRAPSFLRARASIYIYKKQMKIRTRKHGQGRQNRTDRTDRQNRTGRTGQAERDRQNGTGRTGQAEQGRQIGTERTGQDRSTG
jgi:hypothetical protein